MGLLRLASRKSLSRGKSATPAPATSIGAKMRDLGKGPGSVFDRAVLTSDLASERGYRLPGGTRHLLSC
jgi:hypothetical protein